MNSVNQTEEEHQRKALTHHYTFILACIFLCIALFLAFKINHQLHEHPFPRPREINVNLIQGWMTIPYISRTYLVPEEVILRLLNVSTNDTRTLTLNKIAKLQGKSSSQVIEEVRKIIQTFQESHKSPPPRTKDQ